MKRIKFGVALLFLQIIVIGGLLVFPKLPMSKAVSWRQNNALGFDLEATYVRGGKVGKDKLNQEVSAYLDTFDRYYEQDILHFNHIKVVAETPHLSVVEIRTELLHNATVESNGAYVPAGEKTVELWVYADGDTVQTKWITIADTTKTA